MDEILNIEYHKKRLVVKALNKFKTMKEAADALGVSERNVWQLKVEYNIRKDSKTNQYSISENKKFLQKEKSLVSFG